MANDQNAELLYLLEMEDRRHLGDSAVDDFTAVLFRALGYAKRNRVARTPKGLVLSICDKDDDAPVEICIMDANTGDVLLLAQEDKRLSRGDGADRGAQLIAQAIAAFDNNSYRVRNDFDPLDEKIIPGITMKGTLPMFYEIPVSRDLVEHVARGTYPPNPTHVAFCLPPVPRPTCRDVERMRPLDNRYPFLSCYEAFKTVIGI